MTPEERAAAIGAQFPANGIQYSFNGIVFNVTNCRVQGPAVQVHVEAWTGAGQNKVYLPLDDGEFRFVNPPLMVADGLDGQGNKTYARNDLAAAQQIIYDAVTACATRLGWTP